MRYYVVSDVHSFYTEMIKALTEKGYFDDKEPHKVIICGDMFDRGSESVEMQKFIMELLEKDEVILIRGNHEELILSLINNAEYNFGYGIEYTHHWSNGTVKPYVETVIDKITFGSVDLPNIIKDFGKEIEEIELCGLCTDICVISNAMILKATFPEVRLLVDAKCCAGVSVESHNTALDAMRAVQIDIL